MVDDELIDIYDITIVFILCGGIQWPFWRISVRYISGNTEYKTSAEGSRIQWELRATSDRRKWIVVVV